jgi:hypothetical protein
LSHAPGTLRSNIDNKGVKIKHGIIKMSAVSKQSGP